ncbi:preprotein translocase subunit YidC [Candidatus Kinetoplastibacterium desouzaii TCC079E]|uniref:Membrane protein insertase YidC n=1 Tax=Candidatus Kinetoplastidibacterium desouzai TCC079E TaxID=1208919 RepID=M1LT86_9PROT|nr:membrane protein insertase YidC [Candidatus Kinetoplastibacterium desouzaii]AGF47301.1 preprotein translocase subunit YidC [Candidatus Kinetoplastibacterium desouzaii TCC079E]
MDIKRTILWIIFSFSLLVIWNNWQIEKTQKSDVLLFDNKKPKSEEQTINNHLSTNSEIIKNNLNIQNSEFTTLENGVLKITFSNNGAQLVKAELLNYSDNNKKPISLLNLTDDFTYIVQSGLIGSSSLPNHYSKFNLNYKTQDADKSEAEFSCEQNGVLLIKKFILENGKYNIQVKHKIINKSENILNSNIYFQIMRDNSEPTESSRFYNTFTGMAVFSEKEKFQKISFQDVSKNKAKYIQKTDNGWIAMVQHYFTTAWIPTENSTRRNEIIELDKNKKIFAIRTIQSLKSIEPNGFLENESQLWVGPQDQNKMASIANGLDLVVDYGIFTIIAKPIFSLMNFIYSFIKNWGWSIVILTLMIKILFFPLASKSYRSMSKLKDISPRIQALRKQYGDDAQQFNSAVMEMYRKEKINPLGGCLPILVQIPVFISLYWVLLSSVEMRGAPWILWINDLSTRDPYFILPIVMIITMIIQIKLNPAPPDPLQAKIMMIMPLVFGGMMFFFPSGLVLYWCINNILSIAQQWFITRNIK